MSQTKVHPVLKSMSKQSNTLTEAHVQAQVNELAKLTGSKLVAASFTATDMRLLLVDSLQKLAALSPPDEGEKNISNNNARFKAGGPQPRTKKELRSWLKEYCRGVKNHGEPNTWNVTLVTDMSNLFYDMKTFNAPIDQWDTSQVTNMSNMFMWATSFNQPIAMDTSKVTNMSNMFRYASSFNQPITMDTSNVTDMRGMFEDASSFNQAITMDTSKVTDMKSMFDDATAMTHPVLSCSSVGLNAGVPQPKTKEELQTWIKEYCRGVKNHGEPNTWDVTLVTDMSNLFYDMKTFNAPIDQWDTSQVTNMSCMFAGAKSFNQPITMDTSKVTNMSAMFSFASSFNQLITMDTSKVTDMSYMFYYASSFNQLITMDTSKVTNMNAMFSNAWAMKHPVPSC
jgi:surface protein